MDRLLQDLRHAVRVLLKTPGFSLVVVFTLAVGIGANTAMFSIVNGVLLSGLPFPDPSRLVDVNEVERRDRGPGAIAPATFVDWQQTATSFDALSAYWRRTFNVTLAAGEPERLSGAVTSSTFFDVLGVPTVLGRSFTRADAEPGQGQSVVVSFGFWQRRFAGSPDAIGQAVRLDGTPHTVIGVMPATVNFPQGAELWIPAAYDVPSPGPPDPRAIRDMHFLRAIGRLTAGTAIDTANAELATISDRLAAAYPAESANFIGVARPLQDQLVRSARTPLLVLLGAVGCVLLIVVANVANLLMARATARTRELAIRAAVGAHRRMIVRQLLTESVLLALVGGGLGVLVAFWSVDAILALDPGDVPRVAPIGVDGAALAFALVLSVATGILFGLVPAWQASQPDLQSALKESARGTTGDGHRRFARAGLVLAEVSLSLVLLVGAGLLFRSLMTLVDVPLGFTTDRILTVQVAPTGENYRSSGQLVAYWDRVLAGARALPGVEAAALTTSLPMSGGRTVIAFNVEGKPEVPLNQQPLARWLDVSPGYFATLGIPVVRGREFTEADAVDQARVIVISQAMARREFEGLDPIGRRFSFDSDERGQPIWSEIVGVVADVRHDRADEAPGPMAYGVHTGAARSAQYVIVRTAGSPSGLAAPLRAALQALDASLPVSQARTLDADVGASLTQRRFNVSVLAVFALIALVLALAGIYGTVSYAVAQRANEIGIRVALGATTREILRLVLVDALKPVAAGLVVGLGAALVFTRTLQGLLFGVSATDPLTFLSLPLVLALVAFVASLVPAMRATRVDPLEALRIE
ncbi:MAG: ABC transporter permease [Vicinamibacterales bacterium]